MAAPIWLASADGRLDDLLQLLTDTQNGPQEVDVKDAAGVTALAIAVKNGHVEVVRVLLEKGADPNNGITEESSEDPAILELLATARNRISQPVPNGLHPSPPSDANKHFYAPPPGPYGFYPPMGQPPAHMQDGAVFYPPPSHIPSDASSGGNNLPPPEIARHIPCRYFPACRYGASCMFLHPQTQYFQGSVPPPAQYPAAYDASFPQSYPANYYPPPFQPGAHPQPPVPSPPTHSANHVSSPTEMMPPSQPPYNPNHTPPAPQYGHMYPQVPVPIPQMSGPQMHQPQQNVGSPTTIYPSMPPPPHPAYPTQGPIAYPPPPMQAVPVYPSEVNGNAPGPEKSEEHPLSSNPPHGRDSPNQTRRGNGRRISVAGRKPSCLFFPSGRCKNGNECRFPHVLPDNLHQNPALMNRTLSSKPRQNGGTIEDRFAGMAIRDDQSRSAKDNFGDSGNRQRFSQGFKKQHFNNNGSVSYNKRPPVTKQRVPNADEFPVLPGATTPPSRPNGLVNGNGHAGPTAAQVLQRPAPSRRESAKDVVTPALPVTENDKPAKELKPNGDVATTEVPPSSPPKLPVSFAAAAAAASMSAGSDTPKEISVTA